MTVYIIMLALSMLLLLLARVFENKKININKNIFYILSALVLIIVSGLRYNVGEDYRSYVQIFNYALAGIRAGNIDYGFYFFIKIIQFFTSDFLWMFLATSVVFFAFVYKAIKEQSCMPVLSVFLLITTGYFFGFLNGMRQFISVSIFFYSIKYIKSRNFKLFLLCMVPAILLHMSSIICIPIYFLYGKKNNSNIMIVATFIFFLLFKPAITQLILYVVSLTKYSSYIGGAFDVNNFSLIQVVINVIILIMALFYNRKSLTKDNDYSFYCILQLIYTILTVYVGSVPLISRLRWFFGLPIIVFIPKLLQREKNAKTRLLYTCIIFILYFAYFYYTIGILNYNNVLPFRWIFERN